jgi:hypothetical protein
VIADAPLDVLPIHAPRIVKERNLAISDASQLSNPGAIRNESDGISMAHRESELEMTNLSFWGTDTVFPYLLRHPRNLVH